MTYFSHRAGGVTRIKRDSYGGEWFAFCAKVRERDHGQCVFCKAPEDKRNGEYHDVHHLIPLERGGRTVMSNLALTCKKCHERRHPHLHRSGYGKRKKRP